MKNGKSEKRTAAGDALTDLVLEVFRFNGLLMEMGDRRIKHLGITSTLWQVLDALNGAPLPMAQIARNMGLTRQSVRRSAYKLRDKGMVGFSENPDHQRAKLVELTPQGRLILDQVNQIQIEWANAASSKFEAEKLNELIETMKQIEKKLSTV